MAVERLTISLESRLAAAVRDAAAAKEQSVSVWLAEAACSRLLTRGLSDVVADWEAVHGKLTETELARARTELRH
ncbi:hypothetical protein [Candidatus Poriferisodalis sp.]|uniref:hypothetical protein n=1 Tax=Candidatus Poriferisodalis sp. TaxID=3101277 RepID=UPI003B5CA083